MAIITEPVSEMAILSSEKTRQTALALKGAGIISWQMPEDTYGVFDAFKKVSDTYTCDWLLLSVAKRRERNILRRLVASNLYSSGRIAEPVSWKPTKEEEFIEESYPSQLAGMVDSLKEAYELGSFGRLTVVDGGAEFNEAFSLESLYNPVESDEYSWNWCVKLQGFRKEVLRNIAGFGYDSGYSAGKCVICGDYCSMCLEELTEWAALKRGGSRVVCENCANGGIWPTCVGV